MMNTTNAAVITGVTVTVGRWSAGQPMTIRVVVGAAAAAIGLSLLGEMSPELASRFGLVIVIVSLFMYGPAIAWKANLIDHKRYPKPPMWG